MDKEFWTHHYPLEKDFWQIPPTDLLAILAHTSKQDSILEIGCGKGIFLERLEQMGYSQISGCDVSEVALESAKKRCQRATLFILDGNTDSLPGPYDMIVMHLTLAFIDNRDHILREIARNSSSFLLVTPLLDANGASQYKPHIALDRSGLELLLARYFTKIEVMGTYSVDPMEPTVAIFLCEK